MTADHPPSSDSWPAVAALMRTARGSLGDAARASSPADRYAAAHLAALRAAAAVLAARARPDTTARPARARGRPASAWTLLAAVAPELTEWAAFFAAGAGKRAAAEAGITRVISSREADDLLRDSEAFLRLVERTVHRSLGPPPAGDPLPGIAVVATATAATRSPAGRARLSWGSTHVSVAPRAGVG